MSSVIGDIWKIIWADLEVHEMLGKGFFGEVRRATWKGNFQLEKEIPNSEN